MKIKNVIGILVLVAVILAVAVGSVLGVNKKAEKNSIGSEKAMEIALADAGFEESEVEKLKTKFGKENGQYVFEVEFTKDGRKYEYDILGSDGTILKNEVKSEDDDFGKKGNRKKEQKETKNKKEGLKESQREKIREKMEQREEREFRDEREQRREEREQSPNYDFEGLREQIKNKGPNKPGRERVDLEQAKEIAVEDAGCDMAKVKFIKAELDRDDRERVFDIAFIYNEVEYEYEISREDGKILSKEKDGKPERITRQREEREEDPRDSRPFITIREAKDIASQHAGVTKPEFSEAKLTNDDGVLIYEIEFTADNVKYEYEIDAVGGKVLDFEKGKAE